MLIKLLLTLSCIAFLLGGCKQYAYYQSPFHANTSSYKVMPLGAVKPGSETHASGALITGTAGHNWRDGYWGFNGNLYRSHASGAFRAFYGLSGTLGAYRVRSVSNKDNTGGTGQTKYPNDSLINARAGSKFFAGLGGTAGFYLATPFNGDGEFRIIGAELNYMHEFGHYLSFRNNLPDTATNLNSKYSNFLTVGAHSELLWETRRGSSGFKMGAVLSTQKLTRYDQDGNASTIVPGYWSFTYHFTHDRATGFWQANFGTYTANMLMGISYRISK